MNNVLELKGKFSEENNMARGGGTNLPSKGVVCSDKLKDLRNNLSNLYNFWNDEKILSGALISATYSKVTAKSNRMSALLSKPGGIPNDTVVGARFAEENIRKHVITHYVSLNSLAESINLIDITLDILVKEFDSNINAEKIDVLTQFGANKRKLPVRNVDFSKYGISRSKFLSVIVDSYYVEKFEVIENKKNIQRQSIISIYQTDEKVEELLEKIGIKLQPRRIIDDTTMLLDPDQLTILNEKAPYLIAMATEDISKLVADDFEISQDKKIISIPKPGKEPTIGVIDTLFDTNVYFSDWVEYKNMLDPAIPTDKNDYKHGTAISSLIVDGPSFNPTLDDGCGRFKVRHFGVASGRQFSSFSILKSIKEIITTNKDIKVWNLSLGSAEEIEPNFISIEAAILDKIQYENDVIFVISGTNKSIHEEGEKAIGAPADSINSIVVNSVDFDNVSAPYSRKGIVLSFFAKPDISYYGGVKGNPIKVCTPTGEGFGVGTSYAAPWISRKLAYLINILGLSREVAKALLIDSSSDWNTKNSLKKIAYVGHGIVPRDINNIIKTKDDEIRFIIKGTSELYHTYNYNLPVPVYNNAHPFIAKATLCYFPDCSRNQGVDYTNSELNITFGRIKDDNTINSFNNNFQDVEEGHYLNEQNARENFRKWDNSKHIKEILTPKTKVRKAYSSGLWGISIRNKTRLSTIRKGEINFGIVITLKELNGKNRITEFIKQCQLRGWLVNELDIQAKIDIFNTAEEDIKLD